MRAARALGPLLVLIGAFSACTGPGKGPLTAKGVPAHDPVLVGGPFENREFTWYGIPKVIAATDTSPGWKQQGRKLLITGRVLQADGETPAPNALLYYYHTNTAGRYATDPAEPRNMPPDAQGRSHGFIRGWVKTDSMGHYAIHTVRPGTYPTRDAPAHIHATIKEPNDINEYYIDDFVFDDDPLLNSKYRMKLENRCGSGVLRLAQQGDLLVGERDIILGLNIPGHPSASVPGSRSGPNIGEDVFSFMPFHAWGPDKGTKTCPVCKYGWYHGILYFVGDRPNWNAIKAWLRFLEEESLKREKYLKAYFIYGNEQDHGPASRTNELEELGRELGLQRVALTFVPSFADTASEIHLNRIDPGVENTFILYKRSRVIAKFTGLDPTEASFDLIRKELDGTVNPYFDLPRPELR